MVSLCAGVFAEEKDNVAERYVKVKIPFPDTIEDRNSWLTRACYQGSGEPIPLSMAYGDYVYATIPAENKDRTIEAYVPEALEFTDIDDTNPDFHDAKMLSRVGVIKGNEKGEAKLSANVTRAEAVAMVMRFIGLEGLAWEHTSELSAGYAEIEKFSDVTEKDWFYYVVTYARECGIVEGDSPDTFSPSRDVTREEVTAMIARALQYAGLSCPKSEAENNSDKDNISDWAKDAVYKCARAGLVNGIGNNMFDPKASATRAQGATLFTNFHKEYMK